MNSRKRLHRIPPIALTAAFAGIALARHVRYALTADALEGKDWHHHIVAAAKIAAFRWDLPRTLQWYRASLGATFRAIHYPPLTYFASAGLVDLTRLDLLAAFVAVRAAWIALLVIGLYGAGSRWGESPWAGLAACAVGGLSGVVLDQAREINLDFALHATVAFAVYIYALTRGFTVRWASVFLGIACAVALLTKTAAIFFLGPFLLTAPFFDPGRLQATVRARLANAGICAGTAGVLSSWFFAPLLPAVLEDAGRDYLGPRWAASWRFVHAYVTDLVPALFPPLILAAAAGAAALLLLRDRDRFLAPLAATFVGSVLAVSRFAAPCVNYLYPLQTFVALLVARGLRRRTFAAPAALALALVYLWPLALPGVARGITRAQPPPLWARLVYARDADDPDRPLRPTPADWRSTSWSGVREIARLLENRFGAYRGSDIGFIGYEATAWELFEPALNLAHAGEATDADLPPSHAVLLGSGDPVWLGAQPVDRSDSAYRAVLSLPLVVACLPISFSACGTDRCRDVLRDVDALRRERGVDSETAASIRGTRLRVMFLPATPLEPRRGE